MDVEDTVWKNKTFLREDPLSVISNILSHKKYLIWGAKLYVISSQIMCGLGFCLIFYNREWNTLWHELPSFIILELVVECMAFYLVYSQFYSQLQLIISRTCWSINSAGQKLHSKILNDAKWVKLSLAIVICTSLVCIVSYLPIINAEPGSYLYLLIFERYLGRWSFLVNMSVLFIIPVATFAIALPVIRITYTTTHLRYQYCLLNEHLVRISEGCCSEDSGYQNVIFSRLKISVWHHSRIRRLSKALNRDVNFLILLVLVTSVAAFVAAAYFINAGIDPNSNIRMYILMVSWCYSLITSSIHCELLSQESERLFYNAYCCPWLYWNRRNRKILLMLMMACKMPEKINSFNVVNVDYPSMLKILRMTYSILTVFLQMNK